jgi:hypothetical protein
MLDQLSFSGRELLVFVILAVVFATVVYLLETLLFARRRKPAASPLLEARLDAATAALRADLEALKERVENLEAKPPVGSALDTQAATYAEAMRLAREGHSAQELAGRLGISRGEAELIISLRQSGP